MASVRGDAHLGEWQPSRRQISIVDDAAAAMGVTAEQVIGKRKHATVMRARQAACWALRKKFHALSYPMIGRIMGGRDHSTIIHAVQQAEIYREKDEMFRRLTDALLAGEVPSACGVEIDPEVLARLEAQAEMTRKEADLPAEERSTEDVVTRFTTMAASNRRFLTALRGAHPERFAEPETA